MDNENNGLISPGFLDRGDILITSPHSNQTVNITPIVIEVNLFENILQPYVSANFIINDGTSLFTLLPLTGDETIKFEFKIPHPAFKDTIQMEMRVTGIQDLSVGTKVRSSRYVLRCHAKEAFKDWTTRIRKSYSNKPISDMVKEIAQEFLGTTATISPTTGNRTIVIPNMSPQKALAFLGREAKSATYTPSNFTFFSTPKGYFFTTVDELISKGPKDKYFLTEKNYYPKDDLNCPAPGLLGTFSVGDIDKPLEANKPFEFMKVIDFNFLNTFDLERNIRSGTFDSSVLIIDPVMGVLSKNTYNYINDFDKFKRTDKNPSKFIFANSEMGKLKGDSHQRFIVTDYAHNKETPDNKGDFIHFMASSGSMLNYVAAEITIPGDVTRRAGDVIRIGFPEFSSFDETISEENAFISGDYIVTAIKHLWNKENGYQLIMRIAKNSYPKSPETSTKPFGKTEAQELAEGVRPI